MKLNMFASCAPGLENFLAEEIRQLVSPWKDVAPAGRIKPLAGGVQFEGDSDTLAHALLGLGLASRILVRIAMFPVYELAALEKHMHRLPWSGWLQRDVPRSIRVTTRKSKLYHSDAVAERIMRGIQHRLGDSPPVGVDKDETVSLVARMDNDQCTISLDASGEALHRRGYRLQPHKAALREDLARALVVASGWNQKSPLVDPMCGSGTILTEAWILATGRSPGMNRSFGIEDTAIGEKSLEQARKLRKAAIKQIEVPLIGSDRDEMAIQAATKNAAAIGCDLQLTHQAISEAQVGPDPVWIVTNPPWGGRVMKAEQFKSGTKVRATSGRLDEVYSQLGDFRRRCAANSRLTLMTSRRVLAYKTGVNLKSGFLTDAGGIKVNAFVEEAAEESAMDANEIHHE